MTQTWTQALVYLTQIGVSVVALFANKFLFNANNPDDFGMFCAINAVAMLLAGFTFLPIAQAFLLLHSARSSIQDRKILEIAFRNTLAKAALIGTPASVLLFAMNTGFQIKLISVINLSLFYLFEGGKCFYINSVHAEGFDIKHMLYITFDTLIKYGIATIPFESISIATRYNIGGAIAIGVMFAVEASRQSKFAIIIRPQAIRNESKEIFKKLGDFSVYSAIYSTINMGDRLFVLNVYGPETLGPFNISQALASRPFTVLTSASDAINRQKLYKASIVKAKATKLLMKWLLINMILGTILAGIASIFSGVLLRFMLAPELEQQYKYVVYITTAAYLIQSLANPLERYLFAIGYAKSVNKILCTSLLLSILLLGIGNGLYGARILGAFALFCSITSLTSLTIFLKYVKARI